MAIRIPRGYAVDRPYYQEISKGERLSTTEVPMTVYTGLAHERVDQLHHDPVVIEPGTIVGMVTGSYTASGTLVPAMVDVTPNDTGLIKQFGSAEGNDEWGLPAGSSGTISVGVVKPIGVVYQPIYSFILESKFTNYKRNDNVGVVTNYVIQIPVTNDEEEAIRPGDVVSLGTGDNHGIGWTHVQAWSTNKKAGRYKKYESGDDYAQERIVGRCLARLQLGQGTATAGTLLRTDINNSAFTITAGAQAAFKGLEKVQTVPGLGLAGSGTAGLPGWLLGARANSGGTYYALTILIRL